MKRQLLAVAASAAAVTAVTAAVFALKPVAPVLSLGALYVLAVLPIAVWFGIAYALPVSVASMLAFNWFFLPPKHTFQLHDSANWFALAVYVTIAVVVGELAARVRRRAADAERREREAELLADVAARLLQSAHVQDELRSVATGAARALGVVRARIELESLRRPEAHEQMYPLVAGGREVGRLYTDAAADVDALAAARILPGLASLLAVALERERLGYKAVEAETLRRSDAVKTAVLQAVSHDLRSPLTAIRAAREGLESSELSLSSEDRAALLETIRIEGRRLERLVANLLDLSSLNAGAAVPRPELWSVDALVAGALEAVGADGADVVVTLPEEVPLVRADGLQIERVLANLLENALKHARGRVEVRVEARGGDALVWTLDDGPGPQGDPFRSGRGLGLQIARGFAEANGGRVWVEPRPEGGAAFAVALPALQAVRA